MSTNLPVTRRSTELRPFSRYQRRSGNRAEDGDRRKVEQRLVWFEERRKCVPESRRHDPRRDNSQNGLLDVHAHQKRWIDISLRNMTGLATASGRALRWRQRLLQKISPSTSLLTSPHHPSLCLFSQVALTLVSCAVNLTFVIH